MLSTFILLAQDRAIFPHDSDLWQSPAFPVVLVGVLFRYVFHSLRKFHARLGT